jgi:hypothetical protein
MTGRKFHRLHWIHLSNRRHEAHEVLEVYRYRTKTLRREVPINPMSVAELALMPLNEWFTKAHEDQLNIAFSSVRSIAYYKDEYPDNYLEWANESCDLKEPAIAIAKVLVSRAKERVVYSPYRDHAISLKWCQGHRDGYNFGFGFFVECVKLSQSVVEVELGRDLCVDGCEICAEDRRNESRAAVFDPTKTAPNPYDCFRKIVCLKSNRWHYQKAKCPHCDRTIVVVPPGYKQALDWMIRVEALQGREVTF